MDYDKILLTASDDYDGIQVMGADGWLGPADKEALEFIDAVKDYAKHPEKTMDVGGVAMPAELVKIQPSMWYTPKDLTLLVRSIRAAAELWMDADIKRIKGQKFPERTKREAKDAKIAKEMKESKDKHIGRLKKIRDNLLPNFIGSLRRRRDKALKGMKPEAVEALRKRTDIDWVSAGEGQPESEIPSKVKTVLKDLQEKLLSEAELKKMRELYESGKEEVLEKRETVKDVQKKQKVTPVEEDKWVELKRDMTVLQGRIDNLADVLDKMEFIEPKESAKVSYDELTGAEVFKKWEEPGEGTKEIQRPKPAPAKKPEESSGVIIPWGDPVGETKRYYEDLDKQNYQELVKSLTKDAEELTEVKDKEKAKKTLEEIAEDQKAKYRSTVKILGPAQVADQIAWGLTFFKKMHSLYHGALWIHNRMAETPLEERVPEMFKRESPSFRRAEEEAAKPTKSPAAELNAEKDRLVEQVRHFTGIQVRSPEAYAKAAKIQKIAESFSKNTYDNWVWAGSKEAPKWYRDRLEEEKAKKAATGPSQWHVKGFPEIFPKAQTVAKIKEVVDDPASLKMMESELDGLEDFYKKRYVNPGRHLSEEAAKVKKEPRELLAEIIEDQLDAFVESWKHIAKKEITMKSDWVFKKHPNLVKTMSNKDWFPEFKKEKTVPITEGKPSSSAILEYIENNWEKKSLDPKDPDYFGDAMKRFEHFKGQSWFKGDAGGSGGKMQHSKEPLPIVEMTKEVLQGDIADFLKDGKQTPEIFIKKLMSVLGHNMKRMAERDHPLDWASAVTAVRNVLRSIPTTIKGLRVQIPELTEKIVTGPQEKEHKPEHAPEPKEFPWAEKAAAADDNPRWWSPKKRKEEESERGLSQTRQKEVGEREKSQRKMLHYLQPGPWRLRGKGTDIILENLEQALFLERKIKTLHHILEGMLGEEIESIYPYGLIPSREQFQKEMGKGAHDPERLKAIKDFEEGETKKKKEMEESSKKAFLYDFPSQLAFNVASRMAGVKVPKTVEEALQIL